MPFIERDAMVETLAPSRPDQALAERIRLRHADRSFQGAKIHRPQCLIDGGREDRIVIVHDKPVQFLACQTAPKLLHRPLGCRMLSDIPMQNPTSADVRHQDT
jgi:hypothetical protein